MKFIFYDKSAVEMSIITDVLYEEKIPYKIKKYIVKDFIFGDNEDDEDDEDFCIIEELYNIEIYTDLEHFDFIKQIADERIKNRINLEKCFLQESEKDNVRQLHKKNTTNTNNRDKSK